MSPRPYRLGQRQKATEQTRARILTAARELLLASDAFSGFSIDAVARQADVARMTVYHQFGSKIGLLEALSDSLAAHGGMEQLANAFRQPDPLKALDEFITVFSRFWQSDQTRYTSPSSFVCTRSRFREGCESTRRAEKTRPACHRSSLCRKVWKTCSRSTR